MKIRSPKAFPFIFSIAVFLFFVGFLSFQSGRGASNLQVTYIDVSQGDSILLRDPNGFTILIDGGPPSAGAAVVNFIKSKGISTIDVIAASHADSDHIGGLITVLKDPAISVNRVLYNGYAGSTATWNNFTAAVEAKGLALEAVQFPQTLPLGLLTVWVMNPASGLGNPETNDASLVLKIIYNQNEFLFTGDIDATIEATIMARSTPLAADVLKVAHHGSVYSSSPDFIASVAPTDAVISVGNNSYGHPSADTIARIATVGAKIWRTDRDGNILVDADGLSYSVIPQIPDQPLHIFAPLVMNFRVQQGP